MKPPRVFRLRIFRTLLMGLGITLALAPVFGQTYLTFRAEQERILLRAKWKVGPFRIQPILQFRNVGYDNNVYSQERDAGPVSDFTASAGIQANAYLLYRNWIIFSLVENPEYVFFFEEKSERSLNNLFFPSLKMLLFDRFALTGSYRYQKERRRASSEFDVRANEMRNMVSGQLFYETSRQTALGFAGAIESFRYEDISLPGEDFPFSRALNRTEKNLSFQTYYLVFSESQLFLNGRYTDYIFEFPEARWRDSQSSQVEAGIRFPEIGPVEGAFSLGYKKLAPRNKDKKGFTGFIGNTNVSLRAGRFAARARYSRDCVFSFDEANIYFIEGQWSLGCSLYLNSFLRLDYDYSNGRGAYPEPVPVSGPGGQIDEILRRDGYQTHSAGFVIRIVRETGIGLQMNYWERNSNIYAAQRSRWFLGGYLTFEF
jgi:hypothetical protein